MPPYTSAHAAACSKPGPRRATAPCPPAECTRQTMTHRPLSVRAEAASAGVVEVVKLEAVRPSAFVVLGGKSLGLDPVAKG
jgi:hypothetical protein